MLQGVETNIYSQTQNAIKRGVKYGFGEKNSKVDSKKGGKRIDCSGWVSEINRNFIDSVSDTSMSPGSKKELKNIYNQGASEIMRGASKYNNQLLEGEQVNKESLVEGMMIGEDNGQKGWDKGRFKGIDHITQVVKDPTTGQMMISQSSGGDKKGKVNIQTVDQYLNYKNKKGVKLFATMSPAIAKLGDAIKKDPSLLSNAVQNQQPQPNLQQLIDQPTQQNFQLTPNNPTAPSIVPSVINGTLPTIPEPIVTQQDTSNTSSSNCCCQNESSSEKTDENTGKTENTEIKPESILDKITSGLNLPSFDDIKKQFNIPSISDLTDKLNLPNVSDIIPNMDSIVNTGMSEVSNIGNNIGNTIGNTIDSSMSSAYSGISNIMQPISNIEVPETNFNIPEMSRDESMANTISDQTSQSVSDSVVNNISNIQNTSGGERMSRTSSVSIAGGDYFDKDNGIKRSIDDLNIMLLLTGAANVG